MSISSLSMYLILLSIHLWFFFNLYFFNLSNWFDFIGPGFDNWFAKSTSW